MESPLCVSCGTFPASIFCTCQDPDVLVCASCLPLHFMQSPELPHVSYPISAYKYKGVSDYFERLQSRVERVPQVYDSLLKNLETLDYCVEELTDTVEAAITDLREYLAQETHRLKQLRRQLQKDLDEARAEVERTMCDESPQLKAKYAPLLRYCTSESDQLRLFRYCLRPWKPEVRLIDVSDSLMQDFCGLMLPRIGTESIQLHDIQTGQETSVSVKLPEGVMIVLMDSQTILCLGGKPELANVHLLNLITGISTDLPAMTTPRFSAGTLKWLKNLYVFGGNDPPIIQCERLCLQTKVWTPLPPMIQAKSSFCPCRHEDLVYLPSAGTTLEVFSLITETYSLLTCKIPLKSGPSVSFLVEGELYVLAAGQLARQRLDSDFSVTELAPNTVESCTTVITPMHLGGLVFWVRPIDSEVIRFDPTTLSLDLHLVSQYTGPVALPHEGS